MNLAAKWPKNDFRSFGLDKSRAIIFSHFYETYQVFVGEVRSCLLVLPSNGMLNEDDFDAADNADADRWWQR